MTKAKVVAIANLKGGVGKSTLTRVLALITESVMLNLDDKRDASAYSSKEIKQKNIPKDIPVVNTAEGLKVGDKTLAIDTEFIFLDFGGVFDTRIPLSLADYYIIPTVGDDESMKEGIRTAKFIAKYNPKAQILFIFNMFAERSKERLVLQKEELKNLLIANGLQSSSIIDLPYNALYPKLTTKQLSLQTLMKSPLESYRLTKTFMPKINEIIDVIRN